MNHTPNDKEMKKLEELIAVNSAEYALIRLTPTMLQKSIIDASYFVRLILRENDIVDYDQIEQGGENKIYKTVKVVNVEDGHFETVICKTSFYRPKSKKGDPRFWISGIKDISCAGTLLYMTVVKGEVVVIPLSTDLNIKDLISIFDVKIDQLEKIKKELIRLLQDLKANGPIRSVAGKKRSPKDVGETLEDALAIKANSSKLPDYGGCIELKAKRSKGQTKDTLFSMVPDWEISNIKSANEMIRKYGYDSKKYEGFKDLYVTVSMKKNAQGLYLELDEDKGLLKQIYESNSGKKFVTCQWRLKDIRERLEQKHPATMWVLGDEIVGHDGTIYFDYNQVAYTEQPLFSSFLLLLQQGYITYDWRGRVKADGTKYKDKGHCFRVNPKYRHLLFKTNVTELV